MFCCLGARGGIKLVAFTLIMTGSVNGFLFHNTSSLFLAFDHPLIISYFTPWPLRLSALIPGCVHRTTSMNGRQGVTIVIRERIVLCNAAVIDPMTWCNSIREDSLPGLSWVGSCISSLLVR